jgi:hypothetical protein
MTIFTSLFFLNRSCILQLDSSSLVWMFPKTDQTQDTIEILVAILRLLRCQMKVLYYNDLQKGICCVQWSRDVILQDRISTWRFRQIYWSTRCSNLHMKPVGVSQTQPVYLDIAVVYRRSSFAVMFEGKLFNANRTFNVKSWNASVSRRTYENNKIHVHMH